MATRLTHKVRNPKDLSQWLELWTAEITKTTGNPSEINYTINPSKEWKIPITNVTVESGENIVTSKNPFYEKATDFSPNTVYYILDNNGEYKEANPQPTADNFNPDIYYIQNDEGIAYINQNKITKTIKADRGLSIKNNNTIGHSNNSITEATIGPTSSNEPSNSTEGVSIYIPSFTYDSYGHITEGNNIAYTVKNLTINNLSENFTPAKGNQTDKSFNETVVDIIGDNINNLPINSADNNGIVKAVKEKNEQGQITDYHVNEVWASGNKIDGNNNTPEPTWRKITNDMISDDEDEKISGSKIEINSANSSGVIPAPELSSGPQFWGVPSDTYEQAKAGNFNSNTTYYTLEDNGEYEKVDQLTKTDFDQDPTKYYYIPEKSPQWSSMTLSAKPLSITYDRSTSTLQIGISEQEWETAMIKIDNKDTSVPSSWNEYIVRAVEYTLS